jgi:hypothetical protein
MASRPLVSIIIAVKNTDEYFERCIFGDPTRGANENEIVTISSKLTQKTYQNAQRLPESLPQDSDSFWYDIFVRFAAGGFGKQRISPVGQKDYCSNAED